MLKIMFSIFVLVSLTAFAHSIPDYCSRNDVFKLSLPIYPDKNSSSQFEYRYQFIGTDSSQPVVIYLPGGPGITSMSGLPKGPYQPLPPSLINVVYTDQRGVGCNNGDFNNGPTDVFSSQYFAEDVLAMIKDLGAKGFKKYILYGHSFGTLHATKTAYLIQQRRKAGDQIELPLAVVLEGTIGRAYQKGEALAEYETQWLNVKSFLSPEVQEKLSSHALPFFASTENWGYFIMQLLYLGRIPKSAGIPDLNAKLELLSLPNNDPRLASLKEQISNSNFEGFAPSFITITCHEFAEDFFARPLLLTGHFSTDGNLCNDSELISKFDSADYQLEVPIIYFQGTNDAATSMKQAQYHYKFQTHTPKKSFVNVSEAGHISFQFSLFSCKEKLWNTILTNQELTSNDLKSCIWDWPVQVTH